jgi:lysine 6-dehydrogenase
MKALVIGSGRMGRAAAWDLARQPGVSHVKLVDRDEASLRSAERELARLITSARFDGRKPPKIEAERAVLTPEAEPARIEALLAGHDVALGAADYSLNLALTRAAIAARVHFCDLGGNNDVVSQQLALSEQATRRGVSVIPDCGLAPGLAGLLAALAVERLGSADRVAIRVGGLPAHPKPPLNYMIVFSVRGLTNEYLEDCEVLREGELIRVPALTETEPVEFPPFGTLEAFHTSGGASTLPRTLRGRVRNLDYKTLRYPGHAAVFQALSALGFLSETPVRGVVPRTFSEQLLERALASETDTDVALLRVTAELDAPRRRRITYELVDRHDAATGHSAMARTTAYPAAAVAYMLAAGAITRRGVLPGELAVPLDELVNALRTRGLDIRESDVSA